MTTEGESAVGSISARNRTTHYVKYLRTDENGEFDFPTIPGLHEIYATTDFGRSKVAKVNVVENATAEVQLVVDRRGSLNVLLEGLGDTEKASLRVVKGGTTIQERRDVGNGEVLIEGIPVGQHRLTVSTTASRSMSTTFEIVDRDGETNTTISFWGDASLSGRVLTGGSAIPLVRLRAKPKDSRLASGWSSVYDDGSYEIRGLDDGQYEVTVHRLETGVVFFGEEAAIVGRSNVLVSGNTHLDIALGSISLAGTVNPVDESAGANVRLYRVGEGMPIRNAPVDVRGRFQFVGLTP